eukprot:4698996-Ditylum_brightwellii.AAC.1
MGMVLEERLQCSGGAELGTVGYGQVWLGTDCRVQVPLVAFEDGGVVECGRLREREVERGGGNGGWGLCADGVDGSVKSGEVVGIGVGGV